MSNTDPPSVTPKPQPPRKSVFLIVRRRIALLLVVYLIVLGILTYFQRSLIYHPVRCNRLLARESGLPYAVVDLMVKSYDGLILHGWHSLVGTLPKSDSIDAKGALANGRPVVLFFSGNGGDRSMRQFQLALFGSLNAHAVIFDYRGYADNEGNPSEENLARDARSIWDHLTQDLGIPSGQIVVYGESLGGGVATRLVSELCQSGIEPGGLIIQSTFNSLVAAGQAHFPWLPVSLLLFDRFPSDQRIPQVTCPILQIHGKQDTIVPLRLGQQLFDAAPAKSRSGIPKNQLVLPAADHNDVYATVDGPNAKIVVALRQFLESIVVAFE